MTADHQVINQFDIQNLAGRDELFGDGNILR